MNIATYDKNAHKTIANSTQDHLDKVLTAEFISILRRFVELARTIDTYKKSAFYGRNIETFPNPGPVDQIKIKEYRERVPFQFIHGVLGIAGESGEVVELLLKAFDGEDVKELSKEELGDVLWYLTIAAKANETPLEEVAKFNNEKLAARWGEDTEKADFKD